MADDRKIRINLDGKETVSPAAKKAGAALENLGDSAEEAARDTRKLDGEIEDLNRSLVGLAAAWAAAGSAEERADIGKSMRGLQGKLRQTMNVRKVMRGVGEEAGQEISVGIVTRLGPVLARAPLSPHLLAAVAPAIPLIASAIGGAVTLGLAGGAVAFGVSRAFKDPAVKSSVDALGKDVDATLTRATRPFVPETIKGVALIRREFHSVGDEIEDIFADSSRYVQPFARGIGGLARELAPGLRDAVRNAEPLVDLVEEHLPRMGRTLGDAMERMSRNAENAKTTLDATLTTLEGMVTVTSKVVELLSSDVVQGAIDPFDFQGGLAGHTKVLKDIEGGFNAAGTAASNAANSTSDYLNTMREATDVNLRARASKRELEAAIDDATETIRENGAGLSDNTAKGRENAATLDRIRGAAFAAAADIRTMGGDQDVANAALERGRQAYVNAAVAAGQNRKEVESLSYQLFGLPSPKPKVTLNSKEAVAQAKAIQDAINGIKGKNVTVGVYFETHGRNAGDLKVSGGYLTKDRWGGMHVPMASGGIMSAGIYAASSPPLIQFAEPATGGEAYIPRRGNRQRSTQILSRAADWYGMDVVSRPTSATRPAMPGMAPSAFASAVAHALARVLRDVPIYRVPDAGRQANVWRRTA